MSVPDKATARPWSLSDKYQERTAIKGPDGFAICETDGVHTHEKYTGSKKQGHWSRHEGKYYRDIPLEEEEANARLIVEAVNEREGLKAERDKLKDKNLQLYSILHDYWKIHNHANAYAHEHSQSRECSLGPLCARIRAALKGGGK